jgi:hypothetical protein
MDGTVLLLQFGAFVGCGLLASIAQGRFFRALERRKPGVSAPDDEILDAIGRRPSRFVPIIATGTRARLSALARSWPYPEVERLRRWAIASIVVTLMIFAWLLLRPGG